MYPVVFKKGQVWTWFNQKSFDVSTFVDSLVIWRTDRLFCSVYMLDKGWYYLVDQIKNRTVLKTYSPLYQSCLRHSLEDRIKLFYKG